MCRLHFKVYCQFLSKCYNYCISLFKANSKMWPFSSRCFNWRMSFHTFTLDNMEITGSQGSRNWFIMQLLEASCERSGVPIQSALKGHWWLMSLSCLYHTCTSTPSLNSVSMPFSVRFFPLLSLYNTFSLSLMGMVIGPLCHSVRCGLQCPLMCNSRH